MQEIIKTAPFIIGTAISPIVLMMTLYVLARPAKPIQKTLVFLLGSLVSIGLITAVIFYTTTFNPNPSPHSDLLPHLIIGALLLFLAFNTYRRGPGKAKAEPEKTKGLIAYFTLGAVIMATNFTTIAMIFEVALDLRESAIQGLEKNIYLLATIIFSLLPILLPLLVLLLAGKHSATILDKLSLFMQRYAYIVTATFFATLGVYTLLKPFI